MRRIDIKQNESVNNARYQADKKAESDRVLSKRGPPPESLEGPPVGVANTPSDPPLKRSRQDASSSSSSGALAPVAAQQAKSGTHWNNILNSNVPKPNLKENIPRCGTLSQQRMATLQVDAKDNPFDGGSNTSKPSSSRSSGSSSSNSRSSSSSSSSQRRQQPPGHSSEIRELTNSPA